MFELEFRVNRDRRLYLYAQRQEPYDVFYERTYKYRLVGYLSEPLEGTFTLNGDEQDPLLFLSAFLLSLARGFEQQADQGKLPRWTKTW